MTEITFAHPERIHIVWAALALVVALGLLELRGRDLLSRFLSRAMQARLVSTRSAGRRLARLVAVLLSVLLGIAALMRPQSRLGRETILSHEASARIMILLDVSRSMLAEDVVPNRLDRAKAEVSDLVRELEGHAVGLTAFAGRAVVLCPMTTDHGFFRLILDGADTESVARGGTRIGDAIRKAIRGFPPGLGAKVIVLVTDGEDHDSYPLDAAKEAVEAGVRIVAIGFGDEGGTEIPVTDPKTGSRTSLRDRDGNEVRSRLDGETLREIVLTTEGVYVPAGVGVLDLESIVSVHVDPLLTTAGAPKSRVVKAERYQGFLLGSIGFLGAAAFLGSGTGRRRNG